MSSASSRTASKVRCQTEGWAQTSLHWIALLTLIRCPSEGPNAGTSQAIDSALHSLFSNRFVEENFKVMLFLSDAHSLSGADSSSHRSLSHVSSDHREQVKEETVVGSMRKGAAEEREAGSTSIEDRVLTAANDSLYNDHISSIGNDKGIRWQTHESWHASACDRSNLLPILPMCDHSVTHIEPKHFQ